MNRFQERRNHRGNIFDESGDWRFREFINFTGTESESYEDYSKVFVSLDGSEGHTRLFHLSKVAQHVGLRPENLYLQFEGENPSGSFKDNGMATAFTHAKMLNLKKVACASTGNTAASMSAFAANEGIEAMVFIGAGKIAIGKLAQTLNYGAKVVQISGDFDDSMAMIKRMARTGKIYVMNSINPFRLEGQKTIIYRVLESLNWHVPDWIVCPGGNLGNGSAFGKAFQELREWNLIKKVPRIAIINAEGSNTLCRLYNQFDVKWNSGSVREQAIEDYYDQLSRLGIKANTEATAIQILKPENLKKH